VGPPTVRVTCHATLHPQFGSVWASRPTHAWAYLGPAAVVRAVYGPLSLSITRYFAALPDATEVRRKRSLGASHCLDSLLSLCQLHSAL
jgi:hypothetical protein